MHLVGSLKNKNVSDSQAMRLILYDKAKEKCASGKKVFVSTYPFVVVNQVFHGDVNFQIFIYLKEGS